MIRALAFLGAMASAVSALAHGDASWIQANPNYKMRTSPAHCCDVSHCRRIQASSVTRVANGWRTSTGQTFVDDRQGLYQSIDADWWACGHSTETWCLFVPEVEG